MGKITGTEITIFMRAVVFGIVIWFVVKPIRDMLDGNLTPTQTLLLGLGILAVWYYFTDTRDAYHTRWFK